MLTAGFIYYPLIFKQPAGTSRGTLNHKESWLIHITSTETGATGWGECSLIPGLSPDDRTSVEQELQQLCSNINGFEEWAGKKGAFFPAFRFGVETALKDLENGGTGILWKNSFAEGVSGIPINGLIWMGSADFMMKQLTEKIKAGFRCIKVKVGALSFEDELKFLRQIRSRFSPQEVELRLDANGAFAPGEALEKIHRLADFNIHSIEQPIRAGQWDEMAWLCAQSPVDIALDEELIGISKMDERIRLLDTILPRYIILKPSLLGGCTEATLWSELAEARRIGWWATSALESNVGLNAIAQWVSAKKTTIPQGLGTGLLYTNNIDSPLYIKDAALYHSPSLAWKYPPQL